MVLKKAISIVTIFLLILLIACDAKKKEEKKDITQMKRKTSYEELGLEYAMKTKAVLGKNLMTRIKEKGTENALKFCSSKAPSLTDSMALLQHVKIKRVSDKTRNPSNSANKSELDYINKGKIILANSGVIPAKVIKTNDKVIAYYPITTNKMCLQCHGDPKSDIKPSTLKKLSSLFPKDMATGYGENELRGLWVVEMDK